MRSNVQVKDKSTMNVEPLVHPLATGQILNFVPENVSLNVSVKMIILKLWMANVIPRKNVNQSSMHPQHLNHFEAPIPI